MSVEYIFAPGTGNELSLSDADIISHDPVHTHTGKGDFELEVPYNRNLDEYVQRKDRVNVVIDGETRFAGYCKDIRHDGVYVTDNGDTGRSSVLRGDGIAKRLEETRPDYESLGGSVTYSQIALDDAIRDYWGRTPFNNVTVYDEATELIAEDQTLQDIDTQTEWESITPDNQGSDLWKVENGDLLTKQVGWFREAENADTQVALSTLFDVGRYTQDEGRETGGNPNENSKIGYTFTPDYTATTDISAGVRIDVTNGENPQFDFIIETGGTTYTNPIPQDALNSGLDWQTTTLPDVDITKGQQVEFRIEFDSLNDGNGNEVVLDCLFAGDGRYNYTFDNTLDSNNLLESPREYKATPEIELNGSNTAFNIAESNVTANINNTGNSQRISVSNNGGDSYTDFDNTDTVTYTHPDPGRTGRLKFRLGPSSETRSDQSPTSGFASQSVDSYVYTVDLDSRTVIDELELTRDHFSNLQTLHQYGSFLWSINHDDSSIADMLVESFTRGSQTKPAPGGFNLQSNKQVEINAKDYYNKIYLEGALRDDGTRPTAEVEDSDAIANDGREITPGVLRDLNITTEAGADFRAQAILQKAQNKKAVRGQVTAAPSFPYAGYAYPIDLGSGKQHITAEEVELTESTSNVQARYDFVDRTGLSREIQDLKQNAAEIGNKV